MRPLYKFLRRILRWTYYRFTKYKQRTVLLLCHDQKQLCRDLARGVNTRPARPFFVASEDMKQARRSIDLHYPQTAKKVVEEADNVCDHVFDLLGSGKTWLGETIPWHVDFTKGYRWPLRYYTDMLPIDPLDDPVKLELKYDGKIPYELSRFQHAQTLGKAYWLTGSEKYTKEFLDEINDWIDNNPPEYGVNWTCSMEIAIRAVNWVWGYQFFDDSPELSDDFRCKILTSLYLHGKHISQNLERNWTGANGNHYLTDIVGLLYLGLTFLGFKKASKWQRFGAEGIVGEMKTQVYLDGVHYEGSTSYHRLVTELFLSATLLGAKNGVVFPDWHMKRLEDMMEFIMLYTKPDGAAPQIGDNDDGRLHILANYGSWDRLDHRYLLSVGAVLFHRPDFKRAAETFHEEAYWLLGERALAEFNDLPGGESPVSSKAFAEGGYYVMRKDNLYMIVDCIPCNSKSPSGHKHNSRLSFELFAYDKSFIIDPGTYVYTADKQMRNLFRSTRYHNTVSVDDEEQNRFDDDRLFTLRSDAAVTVNRWEVTDGYDVLDAEHSGYRRLKSPVLHRRQILFDKVDGYWVVRDTLSGEGTHQFDVYFHFAPLKVELDAVSPLTLRTRSKGANLAIVCLETKGVSLEVAKGWVSYRYGVKTEAPVAKYSKKSQAPTTFCYALYPYTGEIDAREVMEAASASIALHFGGSQ